ncbi:hypothetical protein [Desulfallas thermosapovorans]|nr:hypothetical protein [Desulfallas thermosapovorans]
MARKVTKGKKAPPKGKQKVQDQQMAGFAVAALKKAGRKKK